MLRKTKDFDRQVMKDIYDFEKFSIKPIKKKGSYFRKNYNELVTDIDINFYFDEKKDVEQPFLDIFQTAKKNPHFVFLYMKCGSYDIKNICELSHFGDCTFNPKNIDMWLEHIKNKIDKETYEKVSKLLSKEISLRDVMDVNILIKKYKEIIWNEKEIKDGFVIHKTDKIFLKDAVKQDNYALIRFLYIYRNMSCIFDFTVKTSSPDRNISILERYYTDDYYKILKSFRWYLKENAMKPYFSLVDTLKDLIIFESKKELYDFILKYKPALNVQLNNLRIILHDFCKFFNIKFDNINEEIKAQMTFKCKSIMKQLEPLIDPTKLKDIYVFKYYVNKSQIKININELIKRFENGNECPFLIFQKNEIETLADFSVRSLLSLEEITGCIDQVNKDPSYVVKNIFKNKTYTIRKTEKLSFFENGILKETSENTLSNLKRFQKMFFEF